MTGISYCRHRHFLLSFNTFHRLTSVHASGLLLEDILSSLHVITEPNLLQALLHSLDAKAADSTLQHCSLWVRHLDGQASTSSASFLIHALSPSPLLSSLFI